MNTCSIGKTWRTKAAVREWGEWMAGGLPLIGSHSIDVAQVAVLFFAQHLAQNPTCVIWDQLICNLSSNLKNKSDKTTSCRQCSYLLSVDYIEYIQSYRIQTMLLLSHGLVEQWPVTGFLKCSQCNEKVGERTGGFLVLSHAELRISSHRSCIDLMLVGVSGASPLRSCRQCTPNRWGWGGLWRAYGHKMYFKMPCLDNMLQVRTYQGQHVCICSKLIPFVNTRPSA